MRHNEKNLEGQSYGKDATADQKSQKTKAAYYNRYVTDHTVL